MKKEQVLQGWQALYREKTRAELLNLKGPQPRLRTSPLSEVAIIPFGCGQGITWDGVSRIPLFLE